MSLDLFDKSECCLYALDIFYSDYAASVALAYLAVELACGYVAHDCSKGLACVVAFVTGVYKEQVHLAAFKVNFLYTKALCLAAQGYHAYEFLALYWHLAKTVLHLGFELFYLLGVGQRVEFAV